MTDLDRRNDEMKDFAKRVNTIFSPFAANVIAHDDGALIAAFFIPDRVQRAKVHVLLESILKNFAHGQLL